MTSKGATALVAVAAAVSLQACGDRPDPPRGPTAGFAKPPAPEPIFGIAEPNAWRREPPPASPEQIAALAARTGASSQRFVVDWNLVEPTPPAAGHTYDFRPFDAMYEAATERGLRPLLVALNAPAWAADAGTRPGSLPNNPPSESHLEDWAAFLQAMVRRYPQAIGIEVWNEPNLATFWGAGSIGVRPDPRRYTELLQVSYEAIKTENPRFLVIGGALAPNLVGSDAGNVGAPEFTRTAFEEGAAAYADAWSLHSYPGSLGALPTVTLIGEIRSVRDDAGAATPFWLTEFGISTTGPRAVAETEQARRLADICRMIRSVADIDAMYIHNLIEQAPDTGIEAGFGLVQPLPDGELRLKPAFHAARRACP